jgi:hypothetical protein
MSVPLSRFSILVRVLSRPARHFPDDQRGCVHHSDAAELAEPTVAAVARASLATTVVRRQSHVRRRTTWLGNGRGRGGTQIRTGLFSQPAAKPAGRFWRNLGGRCISRPHRARLFATATASGTSGRVVTSARREFVEAVFVVGERRVARKKPRVRGQSLTGLGGHAKRC